MDDLYALPHKVVNGFYLDEKDSFPNNTVNDDEKPDRLFVYLYNEHTGKREGKWCSLEELKSVRV